jgi:hypothetical protein
MKVGKNIQLETIHKMRDAHAEGVYQCAKKYVEQYYPIKDDDAFRRSFVGYLRKQIAGEKYVTNVEQNINWHELEKLASIYSEYHVNWDAYSYDLELTNQKQIDAWKLCEKLCKVLNNGGEVSKVFSRIPFLENNGQWHPCFEQIQMLK